MSMRNKRDTKKYGLSFDLNDGKTVQDFKNDCDINKIISRFKKTGQLPEVKASVAQYLDLSDVKTEYDDRVNFLRDVEGAFMEQPAQVRKSFQNDPALWLQAVHDGIVAQEAQLNNTPAEPQKPAEQASS